MEQIDIIDIIDNRASARLQIASDCMPAPPETRHSACRCDYPFTKLINQISSTFEKDILKIIPSDVIIYVILSYLVYKCTKESDINIKSLFGYFKTDGRRTKWLIWRGLYYNDANKLSYPMKSNLFSYDDPLEYICKDNIKKLISFPHLTSLILHSCNISELKEYPHLISLTIIYCNNISKLKEYPHLTSLTIRSCHSINELKEYPYLTFLTIRSCHNINELKEYPCLTSLTLRSCDNIDELKKYPLLTYLNIRSCNNIRELKEYPLLTSLNLWLCDNISVLREYPMEGSRSNPTYPMEGSRIRKSKDFRAVEKLLKSKPIYPMEGSRSKPTYPLLTSLRITYCEYLKNIKTKNKEEIQRYIQEYT
uniref:Leucine-rich repeat protein n=1 Tax=Mimivirus LCMiAC02 TaxID=2506609 RepID=A0A481Z338_9VIRU|nr:MAG: hypothetical protein LCMiAC02_03090 [Mimivirus LCMiAC02]